MTNQIALFLAFVALTSLAVDFFVFDFANSLFLSRKFLALTEWMAFWR